MNTKNDWKNRLRRIVGEKKSSRNSFALIASDVLELHAEGYSLHVIWKVAKDTGHFPYTFPIFEKAWLLYKKHQDISQNLQESKLMTPENPQDLQPERAMRPEPAAIQTPNLEPSSGGKEGGERKIITYAGVGERRPFTWDPFPKLMGWNKE